MDSGYFCIYEKYGVFTSSNYSSTELDAINGLIYHISSLENYFTIKTLRSKYIENNTQGFVIKVIQSDFVRKDGRHKYLYKITYNLGYISVFNWEHGKLKHKK